MSAKFFKCEKCGNIVYMIEAKGGDVSKLPQLYKGGTTLSESLYFAS